MTRKLPEEFTTAPMIPSPGDETIHGYPIRDLVIFAEYCRVAGVKPKDLKYFVGDISAIYEVVYEVLQKAMDEHLARCLKECLRPIQSLETGQVSKGGDAE